MCELLRLAPVLSSLLDCNGEGPAFISCLATYSTLTVAAIIITIELLSLSFLTVEPYRGDIHGDKVVSPCTYVYRFIVSQRKYKWCLKNEKIGYKSYLIKSLKECSILHLRWEIQVCVLSHLRMFLQLRALATYPVTRAANFLSISEDLP